MRPADRVKHSDVIRLADYTVHADLIEGYEFSNCRIIGPAVIVPLGVTTIAGCTWDAPNLQAVFWEVPAERTAIIGGVGVLDCTFSKCSFTMVGIAGPPEFRAMLEAGFSEQ